MIPRRPQPVPETSPMPSQALPLSGIRVIDYSHFLAGPHMSRCLSAMGADVIKVERPTAGDAGRASPYIVDGQSGYFLQQNMGKEGLCVNLKDTRGLELLHELVASADVFVENYRPGALEKLGLGYAELGKLNPRLVYCSVSAYGHTGPDAQRAGLRPHCGSEERCHVADRRAGRTAAAVPHADCRHVRRHARRVGHLRRAVRSRAQRPRPAHRHRAVRLHDLDARFRGAVLHDERRQGSAGADRPRSAAKHGLRRVSGA